MVMADNGGKKENRIKTRDYKIKPQHTQNNTPIIILTANVLYLRYNFSFRLKS